MMNKTKIKRYMKHYPDLLVMLLGLIQIIGKDGLLILLLNKIKPISLCMK